MGKRVKPDPHAQAELASLRGWIARLRDEEASVPGRYPLEPLPGLSDPAGVVRHAKWWAEGIASLQSAIRGLREQYEVRAERLEGSGATRAEAPPSDGGAPPEVRMSASVAPDDRPSPTSVPQGSGYAERYREVSQALLEVKIARLGHPSDTIWDLVGPVEQEREWTQNRLQAELEHLERLRAQGLWEADEATPASRAATVNPTYRERAIKARDALALFKAEHGCYPDERETGLPFGGQKKNFHRWVAENCGVVSEAEDKRSPGYTILKKAGVFIRGQKGKSAGLDEQIAALEGFERDA